jgi:hypothetical protein
MSATSRRGMTGAQEFATIRAAIANLERRIAALEKLFDVEPDEVLREIGDELVARAHVDIQQQVARDERAEWLNKKDEEFRLKQATPTSFEPPQFDAHESEKEAKRQFYARWQK